MRCAIKGVRSMSSIRVNGEKQDVMTPLTVQALLELLGYQSTRVAVAVNNEFVPRSAYAEALVQADDAVDVLMAVQGG